MDPTLDIKARLPIEELVGQYCALKKKGRGFVCLCPFHKDSHPSMQVSPDKGIAYCFACSSGGDIFSFYQKIEGVDFRQALKDLAEKTGVKLEKMSMPTPQQKDHKERMRECLEEAQRYFTACLNKSDSARAYLAKRNVTIEEIQEFGLGLAPDSFSDTYQHLLKEDFTRQEIVDASLGIQKDLRDAKIYDRFRNRIMFPIYDVHGSLIGFGGRTLGADDAKYINSGETPLYNKSTALYGLHLAKDAIRESKQVVLVEGYFDVLACHRVGARNTVAVSGTALTEQHVKLLKRYAEKVVLCLDQDRAGRQAAERAFFLCSEQDLPVHAISLQHKDPDEAANADAQGLRNQLMSGAVPYIDLVLTELAAGDVISSTGKHETLKILLPLLEAISSSVERGHYAGKAASLLGTTDTELKEDLARFAGTKTRLQPLRDTKEEDRKLPAEKKGGFSAAEVALGIVLLFPKLHTQLPEMIEPEEEFAAQLYRALKHPPDVEQLTPDMLDLSQESRERVSILALFCEHHGFMEWSNSLALREMSKNCAAANKDLLRRKQIEIALKLQKARQEGNHAEEGKLESQFEEVLKLSKMSAH